MIQATGLTKSFRTGSGTVVAVNDVHLSVNPGDFVLILGRSGSGKSTLLAMLAGLISPTTGKVTIRGTGIGNLSENKAAELRAKEIGFVFQFSGLIPTITALENVLLPTLFCPDSPGSRLRALELLRKVGLSERADAYPGTLSSGEMKRVAIARALINGPAILIADEPTGDLDVDTEIEIMDLFRDLNREGTTIVMVTHSPDLVPYASRVFGMVRGNLTSHLHTGCPVIAGTEACFTGYGLTMDQQHTFHDIYCCLAPEQARAKPRDTLLLCIHCGKYLLRAVPYRRGVGRCRPGHLTDGSGPDGSPGGIYDIPAWLGPGQHRCHCTF